ncbi:MULTISPECIES: DUF563 domain-containing protein [unclassified Sphingobium]|uniref:glycosyltransferase family 61 protein n=1 Tax=unclassified Sphingobium TaxID=2611147 RepID=UPI0035A6A168
MTAESLSKTRTLFVALRPAMLRGDSATVDRLCNDRTVDSLSAHHFFTCISELLRHEYLDAAGALLMRHSQHHHDHRMFAAIRDVRRFAKEKAPDDPVVDRMTQLHSLIYGDDVPTPRQTGYAFLPLQEFPEAHWGTVSIGASPAVPSVHIDRLRSDIDAFKEAMRGATDQPVLEYTDVFLDRYGQVWNEAGCFAINAKRPIVHVDRASVPQIDIGMRAVVATSGLYHWLVNLMPSLAWMVRDNVDPNLPILISGDGPPFETAALDLAGLGGNRLHLVSDVVFARRLISSPIGMRHLRGWDHVQPIFDQMIRSAEEKRGGQIMPRRIYVSRTDARRRPMQNEAALQAAMAARGFTVCVLSELPLWEQVALFHHADVIIGPHGAGLANMVFTRPETRVVELIPIVAGAYKLRFNYLRLSMLRGLRHHAWLETQFAGSDQWTTDIPSFLEFVDTILAGLRESD